MLLFPNCSLLRDAHLKCHGPFLGMPPSTQDWLLTADSWLPTDLNFPIGPCYIPLAWTTHKTLLPTVPLLFSVFTAAEMCLLYYCSTMATSSCSIILAFSHHITMLLSLLRCNSLSPSPKLFASIPESLSATNSPFIPIQNATNHFAVCCLDMTFALTCHLDRKWCNY